MCQKINSLRPIAAPILFIIGVPGIGWIFRAEVSLIISPVPKWFWILIVFVAYPFRKLFDSIFDTWAQELEFALIRCGLLSSFYFHELTGRVSKRNDRRTFELTLTPAVTNRLTIKNNLSAASMLVDGQGAERRDAPTELEARQMRTITFNSRDNLPWPTNGKNEVEVTLILSDMWGRTQSRTILIGMPG